MNPRVISFDLDDTLWAIEPIIRRANRALFDWLEARYPRITRHHDPDTLHQLCLSYMRERPTQRHDLSALRKDFLRYLGRQAEYAEDFAEEAFAVFYAMRNRVEMFPEVEAVLSSLVREYTLIALSNGNACIHRTGLDRFMTMAVTPAEAGAAKPDPAMFRLALERLDESPEAMLHVGDHPEHDVLGAHRAGVRAVWINRSGVGWPESLPRPWAEIPNLDLLHRLLRQPFQAAGQNPV